MKKTNLFKQTRIQVLVVLSMSFLLHACGNKDSNNTTTTPVTYYTSEDGMCWGSNGQQAAPQTCYNGNSWQGGTCYNSMRQPVAPTACTPNGYYIIAGNCYNGNLRGQQEPNRALCGLPATGQYINGQYMNGQYTNGQYTNGQYYGQQQYQYGQQYGQQPYYNQTYPNYNQQYQQQYYPQYSQPQYSNSGYQFYFRY